MYGQLRTEHCPARTKRAQATPLSRGWLECKRRGAAGEAATISLSSLTMDASDTRDGMSSLTDEERGTYVSQSILDEGEGVERGGDATAQPTSSVHLFIHILVNRSPKALVAASSSSWRCSNGPPPKASVREKHRLLNRNQLERACKPLITDLAGAF